MAYTIGSDILDDEYNIFVSGSASGTPNHTVANVGSIYGPGDNGNTGYGQSLPVVPVAAAAEIAATQWATLLGSIDLAASHQGTTITALASPSTGDDVAVLSALQQNITDIFLNRLDASATGTPITAGGSVTRNTLWANQVTATFSVTFGSADQMRYFFNAGGRITIAGSRTGGTLNTKNTTWTNLLTEIGTLNIASPSNANTATIAGVPFTGFTKIGGSGIPLTINTGIGMYDLSSTQTELFRQYSTEVLYTINYARVSAARSGATLTIEVQYVDDEPENDADVGVDGNTNFVVTAVPPATTFISDSWGTPVISGAVVGS